MFERSDKPTAFRAWAGVTAPSPRGAWTLVEVLTAMAILTILLGVLLVGGKTVRNSRRGATAQQQLALLAAAVDQYANFWPKRQIGNIVIADKGWPDFIPGRVFGSCSGGIGLYEETAGFNDTVVMGAGDPAWIDDGTLALNANTCLAFQLLATSGKGPYIHDREGANLRPGSEFTISASPPFYPQFDSACVPGSGTAGRTAEVFVDPWGTPIRYFWVYRDASSTSYRGYLPVDFGPVLNDASAAGVQNASFQQVAAAALQTAAGYILESAGPNQKFGNLWKVNPTQTEIDDAADNVVISP